MESVGVPLHGGLDAVGSADGKMGMQGTDTPVIPPTSSKPRRTTPTYRPWHASFERLPIRAGASFQTVCGTMSKTDFQLLVERSH